MDSPTLDEGLAAFKLRDYRRAEEIFRHLIGTEKAPTSEMHILLARSLWGLGRVDEAVKHLHDALAAFPESQRMHATLGDIHRFLGNHGKAIDCYDASLAAETDDLQSPEYHDFIRDNLASCYESRGNPRHAEGILRELVCRNPHVLRYSRHLYDNLTLQDRHGDAIDFSKIIIPFLHMPNVIKINSPDTPEHEKIRNKKLIVYGVNPLHGHDVSAHELYARLRQKGLNVYCFVDDDPVSERFDGKPVYSIYDLLLEESGSFLLISLYDSELNYSTTIQTMTVSMLGIRENCFIPLKDKGGRGDIYEFDVSLGNNIKQNRLLGVPLPGFAVFGDAGNDAALKIVILGGSTSDAVLFKFLSDGITSWPEILREFLDGNGIPSVVYCGGVGGHGSHMELLKLIRDGILLEPDIVVSYSGFNEYYERDFPFDSFYHKSFIQEFKKAVYDREHPSSWSFMWDFPEVYTNGLQSGKTPERRYIDNVRMMRAISAEFSFAYVPVLQALQGCGDEREFECMERYCNLRKEGSSILRWFSGMNSECYKKLKKSIIPYPYILDYTDLFSGKGTDHYYDACHVTTKGNRIIAQKVYEDLSGMGLLKGKSR